MFGRIFLKADIPSAREKVLVVKQGQQGKILYFVCSFDDISTFSQNDDSRRSSGDAFLPLNPNNTEEVRQAVLRATQRWANPTSQAHPKHKESTTSTSSAGTHKTHMSSVSSAGRHLSQESRRSSGPSRYQNTNSIKKWCELNKLSSL
jgi:hypothetical protein